MPTVQLGKCSSCCGGDCPAYKKFRVKLSSNSSPGTAIYCYYSNGTYDIYGIGTYYPDADIQDYLQNGGTVIGLGILPFPVATAKWEPLGGSLASGIDGILTVVAGVKCTYKQTGRASYSPATGGIIDAPPLS